MTFIAESYAVMTAAEIAAAEVAAATAAEAAAVAAQQTAMELAAQQATQQAAQQTAQQGIMSAPGAAPPPIGAPATPLPPAGGIETVATPPPPATPPPIGVPATPLPPAGSTPVGLEQIGQQGFANPEDAARFDQFVKAFSEGPVDTGYSPYAQFAEGPATSDAYTQLVQNGSPINPNIVDVPPGAESETVAPKFESLTRKELADYTKSEVGSNSFLEGFDAIGKYIKDNPYKSAMYGYTGLSALSALDRPSAPQSQKRTYRRNYVVSPNFVASSPTRPNPYYKPTYAAEGGVMNSFDDSSGMDEPAGLAQGNLQKGLFGLGYADGGITNFAKGTPRDYYADLRRYQAMLESPESQNIEEPYRRAYIVRDDDLDTRYENAFDASIIRLGKNYKRANIGAPVIRRPTPLGAINLSPPGTQQAASGGIMGYNLGGYADGGNPRLLKGPGDGMSDNIPAVIGNSQPARLADGEFVVPADVVSHLGNGSTDAGAKKLHQMMDRIRTDRTGKKKQAPEVNADKYLPGKKKASGGIAGYAEGGVIGYANGGTTYSDQAVNSFVKDMINSGVGGAEIGRALAANGISQAQTARATGLDASTVAQSYAGSASSSSAANLPIRPTSEATIPNFGANQVASYLVTNNITTSAEEAEVQRMFNVNNTTLAEAKRLIAATDPSIQTATNAYQRTIQANPNLAIQNALTTEARMKDLGITSGIPNVVAATERAAQQAAAQQAAATQQTAAQQTAAANEAASRSMAAYRPSFVPRVSGINMSSTMQDPYSDVGLQSLYEQMMGQYKAPTPPMSDTQIRAFAQDFANRNPGKGAELGQALINKGIPVNQAIAATGLSPGTVNTAYIGGQALGTAAPPTLNTQYNYSDPGTYYRPALVDNLSLQNPISDSSTTAVAAANQARADAAAAEVAAAAKSNSATDGGRAGGLMSINRKRKTA